jgi:hypothetical protein
MKRSMGDVQAFYIWNSAIQRWGSQPTRSATPSLLAPYSRPVSLLPRVTQGAQRVLAMKYAKYGVTEQLTVQ